MRCPRLSSVIAALALSAVLSPSVGRAQSAAAAGQIVGQVLDTSGAAIPDAHVTARHTDTNYLRETTTDAAGRYVLPQMPLGVYEVKAGANGFEPAAQQTDVTLGSSITASFRLALGTRTESVQVSSGALTLEPTQAPSKAILTALQIQHLPSNGGRLQAMIWETPGGQVEPECRGLSVAGQKGIFSNISIDGGDYNSTFACGTGSTRGGSGSAPTFNMEALEEFQVTRNVFAAEFGRTTGGVINMATRAGSNQFHDSATYLLRNGGMTSLDAFGNTSLTRDQQVSATVGGPLTKDRTFFFLAPQMQSASKPVIISFAALDQQNLRSSAAAQALLAVAPEGTVDAFSDSQSVVGRLDRVVSDRHRFFTRVDFSHNRALGITGSNGLSTGPSISTLTTSAQSNQTIGQVWSGTALFQLNSILASNRLNEFRFEFGREERPRIAQAEGPQVTVQNAGATVAAYGPQGTGISFGNGQFPSRDNRYQIADNLSIVSGAHTVKVGGDLVRIASDVVFAPGSNGVYTFSSLANYLARTPSAYSQFTGTGQVSSTIEELSFFVQDEWRVRPNLTISPGFRWDGQFNPSYQAPTLPQFRAPGATTIPNDLTQFQPRLALAWDATGDGRTVVRAGSGLYSVPTLMSTFVQSMLFNGGNPELGYSLSTTNAAALANAFKGAGVDLSQAPLGGLPVFTSAQAYQLLNNPANAIGLNTDFIDPHFRNPRALQWKIGVDRQIADGINAGIDFTDIHTTGITRQIDVNLPTPAADATGRLIYTGARPLGSLFGVSQATQSSAEARYRALTMSVNARRPYYVLTGYYTLSFNKSMTDTERPVANIVYDSAANLANDYNWSNLDMRHQVTATGVFFLPAGFDVSTTARALSGRPFSATVGSSGDVNKDGQLTDRPIVDGAVLARNTFRNTAFYDVDLRVERSFELPARKGRVVLSADFFNVFNVRNVQLGSAQMAYGAGTVVQNGAVVSVAPPANFGQLRDANGNYLLTNTPGDPFQAQIGLKWVF